MNGCSPGPSASSERPNRSGSCKLLKQLRGWRGHIPRRASRRLRGNEVDDDKDLRRLGSPQMDPQTHLQHRLTGVARIAASNADSCTGCADIEQQFQHGFPLNPDGMLRRRRHCPQPTIPLRASIITAIFLVAVAVPTAVEANNIRE